MVIVKSPLNWDYSPSQIGLFMAYKMKVINYT